MQRQVLLVTPEEARILWEVLSRERTRSMTNPRRVTPYEIPPTTTEVYVAKTPAGGIPARSSDTPGSADCDIYKINLSSGNLEAISDFSQSVYNLQDTAISGSIYIPIFKEKFSGWVAGSSGGSGTTVKIGKLSANVAHAATGTFTVWDKYGATSEYYTVENQTGETLRTGELLLSYSFTGWDYPLVGPYTLEAC